MKSKYLFIYLLFVIPLVSAVSWPLSPQNSVHEIWHSYAQYQEAGGIHFHEGLDMKVPNATAVYAVKNGTVQRALTNTGGNMYHGYITISDFDNVHIGFRYYHATPANNPMTGVMWAVGDNVTEGQIVARVWEWAGVVPSHLHFERNNDSATWTVHGLNYQDDPMLLLNPNTDITAPILNGNFLYRNGNQEGAGGASYFNTITCNNTKVIRDNIDIITNATEVFNIFNNQTLSVQNISFNIKNKNNNVIVPEQLLAHFGGQFVSTAANFFNATLAQVVYEDDGTANGVDTLGDNGAHVIYYILTNKDNDNIIEGTDAGRYWDTDGIAGVDWNDLNEGGAGEATSNRNAVFPDGLYIVNITAKDERSNIDTKINFTFVNNFNETINSTNSSGNSKSSFNNGESVYIKGSGYINNTQYTVHVFRHRNWNNCDGLYNFAPLVIKNVTTDVNGDIPNTKILDKLDPGRYDVIVDYNEDYLYALPQVGSTIDAINEFNVQEVKSTDKNGTGTNIFDSGEDIYAKAIGLPNNTEVRVYVVKFNNTDWLNTSNINLESIKVTEIVGNPYTKTTDGNGTIAPFIIWPTPHPDDVRKSGRKYNLIVDVDKDGYYNISKDAVDTNLIGAIEQWLQTNSDLEQGDNGTAVIELKDFLNEWTGSNLNVKDSLFDEDTKKVLLEYTKDKGADREVLYLANLDFDAKLLKKFREDSKTSFKVNAVKSIGVFQTLDAESDTKYSLYSIFPDGQFKWWSIPGGTGTPAEKIATISGTDTFPDIDMDDEELGISVWSNIREIDTIDCFPPSGGGPFPEIRYKGDILFSVYNGTDWEPYKNLSESLGPDYLYSNPSVAVDRDGRALAIWLEYIILRQNGCEVGKQMDVRYARWNGTKWTDFGFLQPPHTVPAYVGPDIFTTSSFGDRAILPTDITFTTKTTTIKTRHYSIATWYDFAGTVVLTCDPPDSDPFNFEVDTFWPKYSIWEGDSFQLVPTEIPGKPAPPLYPVISLATVNKLGISADRSNNAKLVFPVLKADYANPCAPGIVEEVRESKKLDGVFWTDAEKYADGLQPDISFLKKDSEAISSYAEFDSATFEYPVKWARELNLTVNFNPIGQLDNAVGALPFTPMPSVGDIPRHKKTVSIWTDTNGIMQGAHKNYSTNAWENILSIGEGRNAEVAGRKGPVFMVNFSCTDNDGDSFNQPGGGSGCGIPDCNDNNPNIFPSASELCNSLDDNCNNQADEDLGTTLCGTGACQVIVDNCINGIQQTCTPNPPTTETCNNIDDNCNGQVDEAGICPLDGDGDSWQSTIDCNDGNAAINPSATEICNNVDDNCDGLIDYTEIGDICAVDADNDGYSPPADCNDNNANIYPGATEICNAIDDNCNGQIDENNVCGADNDGDGYSPPADCNDNNPAIHPGATEVCNSLDDNCDGQVDEGNVCPSAPLYNLTFISRHPLNNTIWAHNNIEFRIFATGSENVSACKLIFDNVEENMETTIIRNTTADCKLKKSSLTDGVHKYKIKVSGVSGNSFTTEERTFTINTILPNQTIQGTLQAIIGDPIDNAADHISHFMISPQNYFLISENIPREAIGKNVTIIGPLVNDNLFGKLILFDPSSSGGSHLSGNQQTRTFLLKFSNIPSEPFTPAAFQSLTFGTTPSVKTFWEENSYTNTSLFNQGVNGWWTLPNPSTFYSTAGIFQILLDAIAVANTNGVQVQNNERVILIVNDITGLGGAGFGTVGYWNISTPYGYRLISISWVAPVGVNNFVLSHELGHNFGFFHSGGVYTSDYGSVWDVMSNGCGYSNNVPHTISSNKIKGHWFNGTDFIEINQNGSFQGTIQPTTKTSGLRAIKIKTNQSDFFFTVEVRKPELYDSCLPAHGVIIHQVKIPVFSGFLDAKPVDATPGDNNLLNAFFTAGQNYTNATYNLTIQIVSQQGDGFLININTIPTAISCGANITTDTTLTQDLTCTGTALNLGANNIILDCNGKVIQGVGTGTGIYNNGYNNTIIKNCNISNFEYGIHEDNAHNNLIINNKLANHGFFGISLLNSNNNSIKNNTAFSNANSGIQLHSSTKNLVSANNITNSFVGMRIRTSSHNNTVLENRLENNQQQGLRISDNSKQNNVTGNMINANGNNGVLDSGVYIASSSENTLSSNTIKGNKPFGIITGQPASNNLIYNNFFNNTVNANDAGVNFWNISKTPSANIIGGSFLGGNFWHDYTGVDLDSDGIGDTQLPYNSGGGIVNGGDFLPLTNVTGISCGSTLIQNLNLTQDLTCTGTALEIGADNIALDCNGHSITGDGIGVDVGINIQQKNNIIVKNCTIKKFSSGIRENLGSSNQLLNNEIKENGNGIATSYSQNSLLQENKILNNSNIGIALGANTLNHTVHKNNISNNYVGISLSGTNNTLISENVINLNTIRGIEISLSNKNILEHNTLSHDSIGIVLAQSHANTLVNNTAMSNIYFGIHLISSNNNNITKNRADFNGNDGIQLFASSNNNTLSQNTLNNNAYHGIQVHTSSNNTLLLNTINNNSNIAGVRLVSSLNSLISSNTIENSPNYGLLLENTNFTTISNNNFSNNNISIKLKSSNNNIIITNNIFNNTLGIWLDPSFNNLIYNNFFNNSINARDDSLNFWNISKTPGVNIIGGAFIGGNFWHDYAGVDTNGDGLGDTLLPYNANNNIQSGGDFLPLTNRIVETTSPLVTILSPQNITYNTPTIFFNFSLNEPGTCLYSLNEGRRNYTMTANASRTGFNAINSSIADGSYTTRAYCADTVGNRNDTESVTFSIDTIPPQVTINLPEEKFHNISLIRFNVSLNEPGFCNYTLDNRVVHSMQRNGERNFNATNSSIADGNYHVRYLCRDLVSNLNETSTRNFSVDTILPRIDYGVGTAPNNTLAKRNWIFVNVSVIEINEANITFFLYNRTALVNRTTYTTPVRSINFTRLPPGNYSYDATIVDRANNRNTTERRFIRLAFPSKNLTSLVIQ